MTFTRSQIDRLVSHSTIREAFNTCKQSADTIVDVCKVDDLLRAEYRYRLIIRNLTDEQRHDSGHTMKVGIVTSVNIAQPKHEIRQPIAAGIGIDQRLTRNLACRIRTFRGSKVGITFPHIHADAVSINLTAAGKNDRQSATSAMLEYMMRHRDI